MGCIFPNGWRCLRAPLKAVAAWMVHRKYLGHDDLPVGWEAANHGTKADKYLITDY